MLYVRPAAYRYTGSASLSTSLVLTSAEGAAVAVNCWRWLPGHGVSLFTRRTV